MAVRDDKFATKSEVKRLNDTMALVIIVLFVGFITMLVGFVTLVIDANGNKHASYEELRSEVQQLNNKLNR